MKSLFLIKLDNLSSTNKIGDLFTFFYSFENSYHLFLKEKLSIQHTYEICFIKDKLWFDNQKHYYQDKHDYFRNFTLEEQQIIILNHFKQFRLHKEYKNNLYLYEFPLEFKIGYGFIIEKHNDDLERFLSLHSCFQKEIINDKNIEQPIAIIPIKDISDIPFYNIENEPPFSIRFKKIAKLIINKKFSQIPLNKLDELYQQIDNLSFPRLKELFIKINSIMNFNLNHDEIDALFINNNQKSDKRERKFSHKP